MNTAQTTKSLYMVSYYDVGYGEYTAFVGVAYSEEEAAMLTPSQDVNYQIGLSLGHKCPEPDSESVRNYRDTFGHSKSIQRLDEANPDFDWGDVPLHSFNPR
jgi:hypothetical protein